MIATIPTKKRFYLYLALIYIVSLIIRIAYALYGSQALTFDEPYYNHIAHQISIGHGFTFEFSAWFTSIPNKPSSVQEPIYPLFLAFMENIFHANQPIGARIVQAFIGAFIPVVIGILGSQIFDYRSSFLASSVLAVYPPLIFFGRYLMTETLYTFLLVGAIFYVLTPIHPGKQYRILAGILWGLACLTRGALLGFIPILLIWIWFSNSQKTRLAITCCVALGLAIAIFPWSVRNYYVHKEIIPITTKGGWNLYFYNYPVPNYDFNGRWDVVPVPNLSSLTEVQRERYYTSQAINGILQHPALFVSFALYKLIDFWNPILENKSFLLIFINIASYGTFAILAFATLPFYALRKNWYAILMWLLICFYTAQAMVFTGGGKARLPIEPFLVLLGSESLVILGSGLLKKYRYHRQIPELRP